MTRPRPPAAVPLESPDEAEAQFYDAMQQGDIVRMMAVWNDDDEIVCVHPGGARFVGPSAIRASFESIFGNGPVPAHPEQVHRLQAPGCAVHHLVERIRVQTPAGVQTGWVLATNVYVKTALGWRMVAHHASPGSAEEMPGSGETPSILH
jgi:ketosteroid isomerase-like protein